MKRFDFEDFLSIIFSVVFGLFYAIWKLISLIFSNIGKFLVDVLKNVYGRIVVAIGGIIIFVIVANLVGLFHK